MRLTGNTIFITGGGSGIGRGLAEAFHARGNTVIVSGRRRSALDEVISANPGMHAIELDITDPESIRGAAKRLIGEYAGLNVLINNAGIMPFDNVGGTVDDGMSQSVLLTNLLGPIRMTSALIEHLKAQPNAAIINTTSVLAFVPLAGNAVYSAAKAALHSYTLSLRFMLRDTSVAVREIVPPWVNTDLVKRSDDPRAMPLSAFIAETIEVLEQASAEVVVERAQAFRANPGPDEHALVHAFNLSVSQNPIPV